MSPDELRNQSGDLDCRVRHALRYHLWVSRSIFRTAGG
jgi:hypothetical protein